MINSLISSGSPACGTSTERTLEAMTEVDCARVIDHQRVLAWAMSLSQPSPLPMPQPAQKSP